MTVLIDDTQRKQLALSATPGVAQKRWKTVKNSKYLSWSNLQISFAKSPSCSFSTNSFVLCVLRRRLKSIHIHRFIPRKSHFFLTDVQSAVVSALRIQNSHMKLHNSVKSPRKLVPSFPPYRVCFLSKNRPKKGSRKVLLSARKACFWNSGTIFGRVVNGLWGGPEKSILGCNPEKKWGYFSF